MEQEIRDAILSDDINYFIRNPQSIDFRLGDNISPLTIAIINHKNTIAKWLLDNNVDITIIDLDEVLSNKEVLKYMITKGKLTESMQCLLFKHAIYTDNFDLLTYLLSLSSVDCNLLFFASNPLYYPPRIRTLKFLIDYGFDPYETNSRGKTYLDKIPKAYKNIRDELELYQKNWSPETHNTYPDHIKDKIKILYLISSSQIADTSFNLLPRVKNPGVKENQLNGA